MSVFCLGPTMADLQSCVTAVGGALTDRSMLWTREDLNCEPAFWAMLPGNFGYIARRSLISSKNLAGSSRCTTTPRAARGRALGDADLDPRDLVPNGLLL